MSLMQWGTLVGVVVASWALSGFVRRYTLTRAILDIPNHRSSHTRPTPRGGGIAIATASVATLVVAAVARWIDWPFSIAAVGGAVIVAGVGWLDDRRHIRPSIRATAHALAAVWMLAWLGGLPRLSFGVHRVTLGLLGSGIAVIGVVWLINLYNFMDGIDGLAGGEAVTVAVFGGGILLSHHSYDLAFVSFLIGAATAGFLVWNWPPANLFMGDVGSGLLGFLFATLAVASENRAGLPLWAWLFLLLVFVTDTTITLIRRLLRGDRISEAHRDHAYQRVVRSGSSHGMVTAAVCSVNVLLALLLAGGLANEAWMPASIAIGAAVVLGLYILAERCHPLSFSGNR